MRVLKNHPAILVILHLVQAKVSLYNLNGNRKVRGLFDINIIVLSVSSFELGGYVYIYIHVPIYVPINLYLFRGPGTFLPGKENWDFTIF